MCLSPVVIQNPYKSGRYVFDGVTCKPASDRFRPTGDTIEVPCGKCSECLNRRYTDLMQRVYVESLTSYVYMVTLTYNEQHVPRLYFSDCGSEVRHRRHSSWVSERRVIYYADFSHLQSMFKRIRNLPIFSDRDFRYLAVSEYGTEKMRPHFHLLFFVGKSEKDSVEFPDKFEKVLYKLFKRQFSINVGTRKNPRYEPLFEYVKRTIDGKECCTYDCHLVRPKDVKGDYIYGADSSTCAATVSSYVMSYVNKTNRFESYIIDSIPSLSLSGISSDILAAFSRKLKCGCHYSKHLGFGFDSLGKRISPVRWNCVPVTLRFCEEFELVDSLPDDFEHFCSAYPLLASGYDEFWNTFREFDFDRKKYDLSLEWFFFRYPSSRLNFLLARKYNPGFIVSFLRYHHFATKDSDVGMFCLRSGLSSPDSRLVSSVAYKYISSAVSSSISRCAYCFQIPIVDSGITRYYPMCAYYVSYFVSDDIRGRLYDALHVFNYDVYIQYMRRMSRLESDRVRTAQSRAAVSSYNTANRISFNRKLQKHPNLFVYDEKIRIFAPDVGFMPPSPTGSDVVLKPREDPLKVAKKRYRRMYNFVKRNVL